MIAKFGKDILPTVISILAVLFTFSLSSIAGEQNLRQKIQKGAAKQISKFISTYPVIFREGQIIKRKEIEIIPKAKTLDKAKSCPREPSCGANYTLSEVECRFDTGESCYWCIHNTRPICDRGFVPMWTIGGYYCICPTMDFCALAYERCFPPGTRVVSESNRSIHAECNSMYSRCIESCPTMNDSPSCQDGFERDLIGADNIPAEDNLFYFCREERPSEVCTTCGSRLSLVMGADRLDGREVLGENDYADIGHDFGGPEVSVNRCVIETKKSD